jgi:hypothetical protein
MRRQIENYALLSDLQAAALVHRRGSIDWCCFPAAAREGAAMIRLLDRRWTS